jgi:prepilin-type N-terminal cleavage/methylation domain-containing protein
MVKIIKKIQNKGLTLIELLIYMSIFSIILLMINSSVFYLQKIIQNNNNNYRIKNQIYFNLNILQQYLYKNSVSVQDKNLNLFNKNNDLILTQKMENSQIKNIYQNKEFEPLYSVYLEKYNVSLIDNNHLLKIEISWKDNRGKIQNLIEYLIVINQNI